METQEYERFRKLWNEQLKIAEEEDRVFVVPFIKDKTPDMFEAFDIMHKMDGTSRGRRRCDFTL